LLDDEEDTSTTKGFEYNGQNKYPDLIESWIKPKSSLQTATIIYSLLVSTVSQLQQLTADIKGVLAKGIVDANMEMLCDQGLLVDLTAIADSENPIDSTTASGRRMNSGHFNNNGG
jgi:hypothetical protein